MKDAHVWWSYVWHEMKKQSNASSSSSSLYCNQLQYEIEGGFSSVSLFDSNNQATVVVNKLRENLRSSTIDLAGVRQVKIKEPTQLGLELT